jgi:uncharacterized protein (DUF1697 family)
VNTHIALFRGINVGGKNMLPMKELVGILDELGFVNVRTYIQSGNVVLQSRKEVTPRVAAEIGRRVSERKGFEPTIVILSEAALQSAAQNNPFPTDDGKALHFFFLGTASKRPNLERLEALRAGSEAFELRGSVFYLHAPAGIGRSKLASNVEQALGVPVTARNWNTVAKLLTMAAEV